MTTAPTEIPEESATAVRVTSTRSAKKALAKMPGLVKDIADALTAGADQPSAAPRQMIQLPLSQIIDSPDNPRAAVGDVAELAASIKSAGLLQPILVAPAASYRAGNNQLPDPTDEGKFVLIAGHRRTAACRLLKMTHIDAIVQDDKVGVAARKAMIIENFQRVDLTPIEEAKAFAELATLGVQQDDIASEVGCSQSHISKRLSLLKLDVEVQAAVVAKQVTLGDALELGKLKEPTAQRSALKTVLEGDRWGRKLEADAAVRTEQRRLDAAAAAAESRAKLKELGIKEVKGLQALFGHRQWDYKLLPTELTKHTKLGLTCAVAFVDETDGTAAYYCSAKKKCAAFPKRQADGATSAEQKAKQEAREKNKQIKLAAEQREPHAQMLAAMPLSDTELLDTILPWLVGATHHSWTKASNQAVQWLTANGTPGFERYHESTYGLVGAMLERDNGSKLLRRVARGAFVAMQEHRLADKYGHELHMFQASAVPYYASLVQLTNYKPTEWEIRQLGKYSGIKGNVFDHLCRAENIKSQA